MTRLPFFALLRLLPLVFLLFAAAPVQAAAVGPGAAAVHGWGALIDV